MGTEIHRCIFQAHLGAVHTSWQTRSRGREPTSDTHKRTSSIYILHNLLGSYIFYQDLPTGCLETPTGGQGVLVGAWDSCLHRIFLPHPSLPRWRPRNGPDIASQHRSPCSHLGGLGAGAAALGWNTSIVRVRPRPPAWGQSARTGGEKEESHGGGSREDDVRDTCWLRD